MVCTLAHFHGLLLVPLRAQLGTKFRPIRQCRMITPITQARLEDSTDRLLLLKIRTK